MQGGLYVSDNYLTLDAEMWIAMSVAEDWSEVYVAGHVVGGLQPWYFSL